MDFRRDMFYVLCVLLFRNMVKFIFEGIKVPECDFGHRKSVFFHFGTTFFITLLGVFSSRKVFLHEIQKNYPSENALVAFFENVKIMFFTSA